MDAKARTSSIAVAAICTLSGCVNVTDPTIPQPPAAPTPQTYSIPSGPLEIDLASYWNQLNDPMLTDFVEQAITANLEVQQSAYRIAQARAVLRGARARYLPDVSGTAGISRDVGDLSRGDFDFSLGADVNWQVDLFGRLSGDVTASRAELQAAGYSLADVQRLIVGAVAQTTIRARSTAVQLAIARDTLANQDENLQIAIWRRQAGLVSSLDVEQARVQRAQTAASIPQLESELAASANAISTLIGESPGRVRELLQPGPGPAAPIPSPPASIGLGLPAELLRRRPDVRGAEFRLAANTARVGVARAQLSPLLALRGNIGSGGLGLGSLFDVITGNLFAGVSQLIFDGGRTRANIDDAQATAQLSLSSWRLAILRALEEVETGAIDLRESRRRTIFLNEANVAADNAALLARSQYRAGLIDFQNLLTAENQLLSTRNAVASAQAAQALTFVQLTQALGGGWNENALAERIVPPPIVLTSDEGASE